MPSQRSLSGIQWGGYLKRATSKISAMSFPTWYPPIGEKWPVPVCQENKVKFTLSPYRIKYMQQICLPKQNFTGKIGINKEELYELINAQGDKK